MLEEFTGSGLNLVRLGRLDQRWTRSWQRRIQFLGIETPLVKPNMTPCSLIQVHFSVCNLLYEAKLFFSPFINGLKRLAKRQ